MTKLQGSTEKQAGEPQFPSGDESPAQGRPEQEVAPQPEDVSSARPDATVSHGSWDLRHKTWRGFTSIVSSARRADEEPPFSDD